MSLSKMLFVTHLHTRTQMHMQASTTFQHSLTRHNSCFWFLVQRIDGLEDPTLDHACSHFPDEASMQCKRCVLAGKYKKKM